MEGYHNKRIVEQGKSEDPGKLVVDTQNTGNSGDHC